MFEVYWAWGLLAALMLAWLAVWPPMGAAAGVAARVRGAGRGLAEGMMFRLDNFETYESILAEYGKGGERSNFPRRKSNWFAALCAVVALAYVVLSRTTYFDASFSAAGIAVRTEPFSLLSVPDSTALWAFTTCCLLRM